MASKGLLREHESVIDLHFEHASGGGHEGELVDVVAVGRQQGLRRTGGSRVVVSDMAIRDAKAHVAPF
jgi:hypothetical protein